MRFWPTESFLIISSLKPAEAENKLKEEINLPIDSFSTIFNGSFSEKQFDRIIKDRVFTIKPALNFRKNLGIQINGFIIPNNNSSLVKITTELDAIAKWILQALFIIVGAISIGVTILHLVKGDYEPVSSLIPCSILLLVYGIATFSFKRESNRAKNNLLEIFEGEIEK